MVDVSRDDEMVHLSDGAALWVVTDNEDRHELPGLVFLHGGAGMWDYLEPVAELVRDSYRTHRYDQRGCGRSSASDAYSLSRYVADLDELREHFGYERWYLFGHSFGATLGLEYAATHGSRVAGLFYCSGLGIGWARHRPTYKARQRMRLTDAESERLEDLSRRDRTWAEEVEWRTLSWLPDFVGQAARDRAAADARTPLALNMECNRAFSLETAAWSEDDERRRWSDVSCPVRIIHGTADPRPADGPELLAASQPDGRFHKVPGAGHKPWHERPDAIARILAGAAGVADRPWRSSQPRRREAGVAGPTPPEAAP